MRRGASRTGEGSAMKEREGTLVTGARGRIFTASVAPHHVYFCFEGHIELEMFEPSMVVVNEAVRAGLTTLYGDGENWKTYAGGYRDAWTRWFLQNRDRLAHTYLVVNSPLLRMGVQVVNLFASNPITALSRGAQLYDKLRAQVPRLREATADWPEDIAARAQGG
jgi:hypothetical protein